MYAEATVPKSLRYHYDQDIIVKEFVIQDAGHHFKYEPKDEYE